MRALPTLNLKGRRANALCRLALLCLLCLLAPAERVSAQERVVPILDASSSAVLGGVRGGRFVGPREAAAALKVGDPFTYFSIDSQNLRGRRLAALHPPDGFCPGTQTFDTRPTETAGVLVGEDPGWDPSVRDTDILWDGFQPSWAELKHWPNRTYKDALANFLNSQGIARPAPQITQALRTDLDGDGTQEVIIVAGSFNPAAGPQGKPGDYSVVLVRKVAGGGVRNILLAGEVDQRTFPPGGPALRHVTAVADLNGDGRLEVVVRSLWEKTYTTEVYELGGGGASKVLGVSCV